MSASPKSQPSPVKILIAEDSPTQAQRLRHMLEQKGYEVGVAGNGRVAMEMAARFRPALIISDVVMPDMDGYELCKTIKADAELKQTPIVLVTTMSDPEDVIKGLECGADNFVLKPYEEEYLLGHVRYVLANREMSSPNDVGMGVTVHFNNRTHFITADRLQILNLLLSTYDAAIQRNRELKHSQEVVEKRSAETLLANRFLQSVIDNIPVTLFVKDATDLTYVRLNRAGELLVGHSQQEMLGRTDHEFFPVEQADAFVEADRAVLAGGVMIELAEESIRTRDKGIRLLHTRKIPILDDFDRPQYLLGISEDVTERRAGEREILRLNAALEQRTAEADAANLAKSTFLATMSHEIRTPMNGMFGMLELLGMTELDAEQRATLEIVRGAADSLLRLIDDILDLTKVESGKLEVRPTAVSIGDLIEDTRRAYSANATGKGLLLLAESDPRISPAVLVDPLRLRQILNNFVSNSLKFTEQGTVEIRAELMRREAGEDRIRFLVRDTGIGISETSQKRLFQPFNQAESDTAQRFGGTGLGLVICRRLAELMGGSVEMQSEPGKGTTLFLELALPVAEALALASSNAAPGRGDNVRVARRAAPSVEDAAAQKTLVLLVDDHPTNRLLLMRQVQALGCAAETANDGVEALARWRSGRFGIVITDCNMPVMDGYELARSIRRLEAEGGLERVPIIACTANALASGASACFAAGMDDCLVKPVDLSAMREKMKRWLPLAVNEAPAPTCEGQVGTGDTEPLNRSMLGALLGGDIAEERSVLGEFRHANDEDAALLESAVAADDSSRIAAACHRIKGASKGVGALPLAEACERVERANEDCDANAIVACMASFQRERCRLSAFFDEMDREA